MTQKRFKCICAYDGTEFLGWQSQRGGRTVQDAIEGGLARIMGEARRVHASGRTDTGVHARGQVFHFDAAWRHGAAALRKALQSQLPESIQLRSVAAVHPRFHARSDATGKRYTYVIYLGPPPPTQVRYCWAIHVPLDVEAMRQAAQSLLGTHDFRPFAALRHDDKEEFPIKTLRRLDIQKNGRFLKITAEADAFLYKMVRSLVGTLVEVGRGKLAPEAPASYFEDPQRKASVVTAPARGLFLEKVEYAARQRAEAKTPDWEAE